jgi:hypothetical protein
MSKIPPFPYHPPGQAADMCSTILGKPGYYLIEAPPQSGKTAFLHYIKQRWSAERNSQTVLYIHLEPSHAHPFTSAITTIYEHLLTIRPLNLPLSTHSTPHINPDILEWIAGEQDGLLILMDGLDKCYPGGWSNFEDIFPDVQWNSVTFVIATRPCRMNMERVLAHTHSIWHNEISPSLLQYANDDIVSVMQQTVGVQDLHAMHRIQTLSCGHALAVWQLCNAMGGIKNNAYMGSISRLNRLPLLPIVHHYCRASLDEMIGRDTPYDIVIQVLCLLSVAKSGLFINQIIEIYSLPSQLDRGVVAKFLQQSMRYIGEQEQCFELFNKHFFNTFFSTHEEYVQFLARANEKLYKWIEGYALKIDAAPTPAYVLQYAAEHLVYHGDHSKLHNIFTQSNWFERIRLPVAEYARVRATIRRTWESAEAALSGENIDAQVVSIIDCAIMDASMSRSLFPELLLEIVALGFWDKAEADQYIQQDDSYSDQDRDFLSKGLAAPAERRHLPKEDRLQQALGEVRLIAQLPADLPPTAYKQVFHAWLRQWEDVGADARRSTEATRLEQFLEALSASDSLFAGDMTSSFNAVFERQQTYTPNAADMIAGGLSGGYHELLQELAILWARTPDYIAYYYFPAIIRALPRSPRAKLLEGLTALAPALVTLFPKVSKRIGTNVEEIIKRYR